MKDLIIICLILAAILFIFEFQETTYPSTAKSPQEIQLPFAGAL